MAALQSDAFVAGVGLGQTEYRHAAQILYGFLGKPVIDQVFGHESGVQRLQEVVATRYQGGLELAHQFFGVAGERVRLEVDTFFVPVFVHDGARSFVLSGVERSEERRVGKGCVGTCRSRWMSVITKTKQYEIDTRAQKK